MVTYTRKLIFLFIDIAMFVLSLYAALFIRFEGNIHSQYLYVFYNSIVQLTATFMIIWTLFGLYKSLWQYASIRELLQVAGGIMVCTATMYLYRILLNIIFPRSIYIIFMLCAIVLMGGSRVAFRLFKRLKNSRNIEKTEQATKVMIIGAGDAGSMLIRELKNHSELKLVPVVMIDDDKWKQQSVINGVPVAGGRGSITDMVEKFGVEQIIIAIPSASKADMSEILTICKQTKCKLKTLPGVYEMIDEEVSVKHIRDVNIEDLLGRDEVKLDNDKIAGYLKDEVVLVTGGGGSIGSELCRQIARYGPEKLIIFDIYENNAYDLQNELIRTYKNKLNLEVLIGSVRDKERLRQLFQKFKPGVVFHAAAHKHVPLMERNPSEAIKNNVLGTLNTAQCADEYGAKRFVLISTDKAVNPTNIMGATKRMAEMIVQSLDKVSDTQFAAVRFGNVLGSNGSVIPLFKKQIEAGGPVTVTHPDIIRYFMTIPEAARLVIQAGAMAEGGEIFILDMGEPVKIVDLARDLIRLSGFKPDEDIKLEYTGLRPGEKLYEELLMAEEGLTKTGNSKIYIGQPMDLSYDEVLLCIKALEKSVGDPVAVRECMSRVVPTYNCAYEEAAAVRVN